MNLKSWALNERPREKLMLKGRSSLSDAELIAILIGSGNHSETAVSLSKRILASVNHNLNDLGKLDLKQLQQFKGIGEAKAISIIAALELGRRRKAQPSITKPIINSSKSAFDFIHEQFIDLTIEEFWVIYLNRRNQVIHKANISKGGVSGTIVDARIIFTHAINQLASSIILVHNHPSGNLKPSQSDLSLTKKIKKAGELMEVLVIDHLIVGEKDYFSFADNGLI